VIDDPAAVDPSPGTQVAPMPAPTLARRLEHATRPAETSFTNGRRRWTAALAVAVLIAAAGLALLYNNDLSMQSANEALTTQNESLQGQNLGIQGELTVTQGRLSTAQSDLAAARAELKHPSLGIWNVRQSVQGPSYYLAAGVPDTFTYHLRLRSTGVVNVSILSFEQFSTAIKCVENGVGPTNWCMHHSGATNSWLGVTSVNFDFHLAEGCAAYMLVITSPGRATVTPNISVTYNPAPHATGTCA
jgi:hypothetical protein